MALLLNEIKELLKSPKQSAAISKAVRHEGRLRFHTEAAMEPTDVAQPLTTFLEWVKTLIPKDKFNIFVSLFQFPISTVELTTSIYNDLERVFDGRNPVVNYEFSDSAYREDWDEYRKKKLNSSEVWRGEAWDRVKKAINSVLVVDIAQEQTGSQPDPYFYFLDIAQVIDFKLAKSGAMDYIAFCQEGNRVAVIDDTSYRVFQKDKNGDILDEPIVENPHDLGYCPAKFMWEDSLLSRTPAVKEAPISNQLANLDWLLFFSVSKKHLDLYAPYPIYSTYEADCDFENAETGDYCDGGFLRDRNKNYKVQRLGTLELCPVCSQKSLAGVGSMVEVPVPRAGEPDLRDPVHITTIDAGSLKYNVDECNRLETKIFKSVVGSGGETQATSAINEMQVSANFESKTSVLNNIKGNLEHTIKFAYDTVCKLRYGERFQGSSYSMGTEFYIYSLSDLYEQYKTAKTNGAAASELDAISEQILVTEYRNNPTKLQRMLILKQLEPYRHFTFTELTSLADKNLLNAEMLNIKINFNTFVERFERENINLVEFGSQLDFYKKVQIINEQFKSYARESIGSGQSTNAGGAKGEV